jgi:hypothetical protein
MEFSTQNLPHTGITAENDKNILSRVSPIKKKGKSIKSQNLRRVSISPRRVENAFDG